MSEQEARPMPRLGGISEIAERTGRPRPVVCNWADRGTYGFPAPVATLKSGRIWDMDEIEAWLTNDPVQESRSADGPAK